MCIQVVERYAECGCLYYKHQVDACPHYRRRGHDVVTRKILVGYTCPSHSSSAVYREHGARARRGQAREEFQSDAPGRVNRSDSLLHAQKESYSLPATDRSDSGRVVGFDESVGWLGPVSLPTETSRDGSNGVVSGRSPPIEEIDSDQEVIDIPDPGGLYHNESKDSDQEVVDIPNPGGFYHNESEDSDQEVVDIPDPDGIYHNESEVQIPASRTAPPGEVGNRCASFSGETTCPHHLSPNVAAYPRECCWNIEQYIERGDAATDISRRQLHHLLRDSLNFAFANLSHSAGAAAMTQSSDPCRGTDTVQLDTLQSDANPETSTSSTTQLPIADADNVNEAESPSTATCHTRETKKRPSIPPCYLLIFLGLLTVIGSLVPGLWQARSRNDLSGGFTLAQYILGVGIFVVGSMVAIHSKTCECWKSHKPVDQVVGAGH